MVSKWTKLILPQFRFRFGNRFHDSNPEPKSFLRSSEEWRSFIKIFQEISFKGASPFLKGKWTYARTNSPFWRVNVFTFKGETPYLKGEQGEAPLWVNELGWMKGASPFWRVNVIRMNQIRVNQTYEGWIKRKP